MRDGEKVREHVRERRLADSAFPVERDVLTFLDGRIYDVLRLWDAAGEQLKIIDRRTGGERVRYACHSLELRPSVCKVIAHVCIVWACTPSVNANSLSLRCGSLRPRW
jgi:hypothetical protein